MHCWLFSLLFTSRLINKTFFSFTIEYIIDLVASGRHLQTRSTLCRTELAAELSFMSKG